MGGGAQRLTLPAFPGLWDVADAQKQPELITKAAPLEINPLLCSRRLILQIASNHCVDWLYFK